jgi:hypothetical protein
MPSRQDGDQRRGEDHIAEESGLDYQGGRLDRLTA